MLRTALLYVEMAVLVVLLGQLARSLTGVIQTKTPRISPGRFGVGSGRSGGVE
jgi:hypothetical protein